MDIVRSTVRSHILHPLYTVSDYCIGNPHNPHAIHKSIIPSRCIHQVAIPPSAVRHGLRLYASAMSALILTRTSYSLFPSLRD